MKVIITTIMVRSGVLTHVCDLANHLHAFGVQVGVAVIKSDKALRSFRLTEQEMFFLSAKFKSEVPVFFYADTKDLLDLCYSFGAQLLHAQSPLTFATSRAVARNLSIPLVVTLHGVLNWTKLYRETLSCAAGIIAVGPEAARFVGNEYTHKLTVIVNGVDLERFCPAQPDAVVDGPLRLMWFGRTNVPTSNGVTFLDRAVGELITQGLSVEAGLLGYATKAETYYLKKYGWSDNPLPYLQQTQLVFGRGRALREAMACGCAGFLLGEGYGGLVSPDWFEDGRFTPLSASVKHGFRLPDEKVITSDILPLYHDRELLYRLRLEARSTAVRFFGVQRMVEATVSVYRRHVTFY
jgi:glycosyltransferase involved in cell wall biosynthesis